MPRNRLQMRDAMRDAGYDLDDYDDNDRVYAIRRVVHSDGRVEYDEGPVAPRSPRRPEPDRDNPYGQGHWQGWNQGFDAGAMRK